MRSILALSFLIISFAITIHARRHDGVRRHYSTSNDDSRVGSRSQLRGHHRRHSHHQHNFRRKHTWERPVAQGRGILSELVDTKNNVISNLFNLNPVRSINFVLHEYAWLCQTRNMTMEKSRLGHLPVWSEACMVWRLKPSAMLEKYLAMCRKASRAS